ncbi:thioesterase family protein [Paeniglutamicibacter psychrophenolicus]|uniref:Acyl-CoA thioester hydrolase n=1 Tax=Paeniglutamicibacter psychrophenolicus TaxID=257454 RepID=A0ABS4W9D6_9MICC|nr:thioesterase family protein [Paeniglutamicibacter psychrophenolicus]MBP2372808.1 acyl-CoA thioester hydrolase [Paeniglutamicibacter psychrophenolicus]
MSENNAVASTGPIDMELQLRWSDEDALGHVNNARVVTLMEEARIRWTQPRSKSGRFPHGTVVASLKLDYLRPLYYQPTMVIQLSVVRIGTKSFSLRHVGIQDGFPVFDGVSVMVPLAEDKTSSRAINDLERAWLESAFVAADA